jgi:hypothetical protein
MLFLVLLTELWKLKDADLQGQRIKSGTIAKELHIDQSTVSRDLHLVQQESAICTSYTTLFILPIPFP